MVYHAEFLMQPVKFAEFGANSRAAGRVRPKRLDTTRFAAHFRRDRDANRRRRGQEEQTTMTAKAGSTANQDSQSSPSSTPQRPPDLDRRYGNIGIEAVAAAARYTGYRQNVAAAPAPQIEQRFIEFAI
jgi:hypothetical protein